MIGVNDGEVGAAAAHLLAEVVVLRQAAQHVGALEPLRLAALREDGGERCQPSRGVNFDRTAHDR